MSINFKEILSEIQAAQLATFCSVNDFRKREHAKLGLPTGRKGLYWFWTNVEIEQLTLEVKDAINNEVPIKRLIENRRGLKYICDLKQSEFLAVYNGKGGGNSSKYCLRQRINQEINGNGPTVGTLNLIRTSNIDNWAISFFDFDALENLTIIEKLGSSVPYNEFAKEIENLWRLEYGTPILCRH